MRGGSPTARAKLALTVVELVVCAGRQNCGPCRSGCGAGWGAGAGAGEMRLDFSGSRSWHPSGGRYSFLPPFGDDQRGRMFFFYYVGSLCVLRLAFGWLCLAVSTV